MRRLTSWLMTAALLGSGLARGDERPAAPKNQDAGHAAPHTGGLKDATPPELSHTDHGNAHAGGGSGGHGPAAGHAAAEHHEEASIYGYAEYLFLKGRSNTLDFAVIDRADDLATQGRLARVSYNGRSAFRAGAGYQFENGWSLGMTYSFLRSSGRSTLGVNPGGVIFPTLTRPGLVDRVTSVIADADLSADLFDIEAGRTIHVDEATKFRLTTGLTFANIRQDLKAQYDGLQANRAIAQTQNKYTGAGPFLGGEATWSLNEKWGLFGKARGGLTIGDAKASLADGNDGGMTRYADLSDNYVKVVPYASMGLGVRYSGHAWFMSAGYEITNWFGAFESARLQDDFAEGRYMPRSGDVSWNGFFVQWGVKF
jgi:hypothetical protein